MRNKFSIVLILLALLCHAQQHSKIFESVLKEAILNHSKIDSFSYFIKTQFKGCYNADTTKKTAKLRFINNHQQTNSWEQPFICIVAKSGDSIVSDGKFISQYQYGKLLSRDPIKKVPRFFEGNSDNIFFFPSLTSIDKAKYFSSYLPDSSGLKALKEVSLNGTLCKVFERKLTYLNPVCTVLSRFYFTKSGSYLIKKEEWVFLQNSEDPDLTQYESQQIVWLTQNGRAIIK